MLDEEDEREEKKIWLTYTNIPLKVRRGRARVKAGQGREELEGQELILRVFGNPCPFPSKL